MVIKRMFFISLYLLLFGVSAESFITDEATDELMEQNLERTLNNTATLADGLSWGDKMNIAWLCTKAMAASTSASISTVYGKIIEHIQLYKKTYMFSCVSTLSLLMTLMSYYDVKNNRENIKASDQNGDNQEEDVMSEVLDDKT